MGALDQLDAATKDYLVTIEGIKDFNKAQKDVLSQGFTNFESNYVVSTHTGTGKTALAHIRIVDTLRKGKRVVYISPFKAIAEEKKDDFEFYKKYGWFTTASTEIDEDKDRRDYSKYQIISMTFEKFDSILNNPKALSGWLREVGLLVVDEGHMISDKTRGATLEAALTKLLASFGNDIRVVLLSAVLPNVNQVANWLKADVGTSNHRPVPLQVGFALYDKKATKKRNQRQLQPLSKPSRYDLEPNQIILRLGNIDDLNIMKMPTLSSLDSAQRDAKLIPFLDKYLPQEQIMRNVGEPVWSLSKQILDEDGRILVFTRSRNEVESLAKRLAAAMTQPFDNSKSYITANDTDAIKQDYIQKMDSGDAKTLAAIMLNGVGFHHAGLSMHTRKLVEAAYKAGHIKIVVCTTTLIAGVNLPATLVIFNSLQQGTEKVSKRDFLNGCGRAGRAEYEKRGIALFILDDIEKALSFLTKPIENVESQFTQETLAFQTLALLKRNKDAALEHTSLADIKKFFNHSYYVAAGKTVDEPAILQQLVEMQMVEMSAAPNLKTGQSSHDFSITPLGYQTVRFYLDPKTGYLISQMILAARATLLKQQHQSQVASFHITTPKHFTLFSVLHTLFQSKELKAAQRITTEEPREVQFNLERQDEMILNLHSYKLGLDEIRRKVIATSMATIDRLEMKDIEDATMASFAELYDKFGSGDFNTIQDNLQWILSAALSMARILLKGDSTEFALCNKIETLLKRFKEEMVKEELLELCSVRDLGRKRSLDLSKAGIITIAQLIDESNRPLVIRILKEKIATKIIENAKKKLGQPHSKML